MNPQSHLNPFPPEAHGTKSDDTSNTSNSNPHVVSQSPFHAAFWVLSSQAQIRLAVTLQQRTHAAKIIPQTELLFSYSV